VFIGAPFYGPFWRYYYPYSYSYPYPYPAPYPNDYPDAYPPDYGAASPAPASSWYYCDDPQGYYPDVRSCNRPWQPVPAAPPPR
jgi:hypothetical protein